MNQKKTRNMMISISGPAGSGKSTVAKMLAQKLGWPRYYMGGMRRAKALEHGMTLEEYNRLAETDQSIDAEVDEYQRKLGKTQDNFIIEGRTSWFFIPHSVKFYLDVDDMEGARRIHGELSNGAQRNEAKGLGTYGDILRSLRERKENDGIRYKKYYGIDVYDPANYDFVIVTTDLSVEDVFNRIYAAAFPESSVAEMPP